MLQPVLLTREPKRLMTERVQQLADLFRTTHKVKTERVVRSRGQRCGDIDIAGYLVNETGRFLWSWTSVSTMTDGEVTLTLVLMDTYTTLMILIGH